MGEEVKFKDVQLVEIEFSQLIEEYKDRLKSEKKGAYLGMSDEDYSSNLTSISLLEEFIISLEHILEIDNTGEEWRLEAEQCRLEAEEKKKNKPKRKRKGVK